MTDTQSRRRALLSLLDQYPLERDLYLHEGRREVSPRDEFADKIEALFMPEQAVEIDVTVTEDCGTLLDSPHFYGQIMPHFYTSKPALSIRTHPHAMPIEIVKELIAYLQKAESLMVGGA